MTKQELRSELLSGQCLDDVLRFRCGQDCFIFKSEYFVPDDHIRYIPDVDLNNIPLDTVVKYEDLEEVISMCYTGNDFVEECGGDEELAERLFWYCDWQHPCSAIDEVQDDDDVAIPLSDPVRVRLLLQDVVHWIVRDEGRDVAIDTLWSLGFEEDELIALNLGSDNITRVIQDHDDDLPFV